MNYLTFDLYYLPDGEDIYGDFEDLESGELHEGGKDESMNESEAESVDENPTEVGEEGKGKTKLELRAEKKKKLKEMFNADYDDGKGI